MAGRRRRVAFPLNDQEDAIVKRLNHSYETCITQVALGCARRNLRAAEENFSALLTELCSRQSADEVLKTKRGLWTYAQDLDSKLTTCRNRKWKRDGITPKPLPTPQGQAVKRMRLRRSRGGKKTKKNAERLALENTVVNLSSHQLTEPQRNLLAKGLSFCPTEPFFDTIELSADLHAFYRRLRLRDYFADKPSATNAKDASALQHTRLHRKSNWQPPKGSTSPEVEFFVRVFHQSLRSSVQNKQPRLTNNLTKVESQALQELQGCKAIVIRPADKGSAVVIQNHSDYRKEVMRQLEDAKFYKHLDKDPTASNNATIREAVKTLRNQGVINDKTAADLVETKAKCPHFYTLPKIHKNAEAPPGRPIVSSIRAPTERISAFVDIVLKPLVKSLPSYIKDTKDFLAKLKSLPGPLPPNSLLFTMDVVGL